MNLLSCWLWMLAMNMNVSCEPEFDMNCNRTSYNPSPPLNLRFHSRVFPSLSRSRPGPHCRPPPRCVRCGVVNKRESSEEDCTWRTWRLGPTRSMVARKESSSLLSWKNVSSTWQLGPTGCIFARKEVPPCFAKKIIHPVDSWDPSDLVTDLWAC